MRAQRVDDVDAVRTAFPLVLVVDGVVEELAGDHVALDSELLVGVAGDPHLGLGDRAWLQVRASGGQAHRRASARLGRRRALGKAPALSAVVRVDARADADVASRARLGSRRSIRAILLARGRYLIIS